MKKSLLLVILVLISVPLLSQTITVIDIITQQPIQEVEVFTLDKSFSLVTGKKGEVKVEGLKSMDTLVFKHLSYETLVSSFYDIQKQKNRVELVEKNITLEEFVFTANRWEEEKIENPFRIEKMVMKEMVFQNPQTSADLIGLTNFAYIQKSQLAGGSPILRGFATNRVMIVVDGVRMNNAIFRTGNIQNVISIDAASLQSTEILFGPGAVMYGSDAIGGVMDFHTLKPKFAHNSKLEVSGSAFSRYATSNNEKTGHIDINLGFKKIALLSSITYSHFDDLRTGSNGNSFFLRPYYQDRINEIDSQIVNRDPHLLVNSGYSQMNFLQKFAYSINDSTLIDYSFIYSTSSNAPRYDRLILDANEDGKLDYAQWYYGPQKWVMNRLGFQNSYKNLFYNNIRFTLAVQNFEESRHDRKFGNNRIRNQKEKVDAISMNLDLEKKFAERITLFYGGEYIYNRVGSKANRKDITNGDISLTTTRYPDGSIWKAFGVYSNIKYQLSRKYTVNAGIRYSYYSIKAKFDTSMFAFPFTSATNKNGSLNGSIGLVYIPNNSWQLYFNGATGFRAPNIDDIGKVFESEPGTVVVPNPNLKPEYAYNFEIGTTKTVGNNFRFNISAYYTLLDNALARRNFTFNGEDTIVYDGAPSQVQAIQNLSHAYIFGVQSEIEISMNNGIGIKSAINYQYGREKSLDSLKYYPLRHAAPLFGSTHFIYKRKKIEADLYANYNGRLDYNDFALSERTDNYTYTKDKDGLPYVASWYTLNLKVAWYINKSIYVNAGCENITDQLYRPYASGISAAGRNFYASLKAVF